MAAAAILNYLVTPAFVTWFTYFLQFSSWKPIRNRQTGKRTDVQDT